jgi:hypothetical protein
LTAIPLCGQTPLMRANCKARELNNSSLSRWD